MIDDEEQTKDRERETTSETGADDEPEAGDPRAFVPETPMPVRRIKGAGTNREPDDGTPRTRPAFGRVVEHVFAVEVRVEDVERLQRELALEDQDVTSPEAIRFALNRAAKNANDAHRLYVVAKVEYELFETGCERYLGPMREEALAKVIEEQGKAGLTDKAVRAKMMKLFGDQMAIEQERRERAKATVEHLRRLADLWKERAFALSAMK